MQAMQAMQVAPPGGQIIYLCKWRHLVAKFLSNASGATWWPNYLLMQVAPPGDQIVYQYKWRHLVAKFLTNASGATWWPNFLLMQLAPPGGQISNKCMWYNLFMFTKFASYKVPPVMVSTHGSVVPLAMFLLLLMILVLKMTKKVANNIILMSNLVN